MDYVEAAAASDIAPGTMRRADVAGMKLLVAHVDGTFYAMRRTCPHMGADLCRGSLEGRIVTCKLHEASFDVATGKPLDKPETRNLQMFLREPTSFPVAIEGGKVLVGL